MERQGSSSSRNKRAKNTSTEEVLGGRYIKRKLLGKGGMGKVYLVEDTVLQGELVALKVLHPDLYTEDSGAQRFQREILLTRKVTHPNVVRTFDAGTVGDRLYFTMEHVPGFTLKEQLKKDGNIDSDTVGEILRQVCAGLGAIHAEGIIHRDIKPGNIICGENGLYKIADFGVARTEVSDLTGHDEVVGSTAYMAPEVWSGKEVTTAADLYSVGVMGFQLLTGRLPFLGRSPAEMMWLHLELDPPSPAEFVEEVPRWLNLLIGSLLEKDFERRPSVANEIESYIRNAQKGVASSVEQLENLTSGEYELIPREAAPDPLIFEGYIPENRSEFDDDLEEKVGLAARLPQSAKIIPSAPSTALQQEPDVESKRSEPKTASSPPPVIAALFSSGVSVIGFAILWFGAVPILADFLADLPGNSKLKTTSEFTLASTILGVLYHAFVAAIPAIGFGLYSKDKVRLRNHISKAIALCCCVFLIFFAFHACVISAEVFLSGYNVKRIHLPSSHDSAIINLYQAALLVPAGTEFTPIIKNGLMRLTRMGDGFTIGGLFYFFVLISYTFLLIEQVLHDAVLRERQSQSRSFRWGISFVALLLIEWIGANILASVPNHELMHITTHKIGALNIPVTRYGAFCAAFNWLVLIGYVVMGHYLYFKKLRKDASAQEASRATRELVKSRTTLTEGVADTSPPNSPESDKS